MYTVIVAIHIVYFQQLRGPHHSGGKHAPCGMSSASSSPNSDLKIVTMSLAKESESGTLGISIIGGKVSLLV